MVRKVNKCSCPDCVACPDEPKYQCCQGPKGDTGEPGAVGAQGCKGDTGDRGEKGETGAQGCKGEKGNTGSKGDTGLTGDKGPQGDDGAQGERGERGETGAQGEQGQKGDTGDTGARGETGAQGEKGDKGDTGAQGAKGDQGDQGLKGDQGEKGDKGDTGAAGAAGETGDQGLKGDDGAQGEKGDPGDTGATGATGPAGNDGAQGLNAFVSKGAPDAAGCFEMTFLDQNGNPQVCQFQECVTLLACGYTGTAICETPVVTGIVEESPTRKIVQFTYPSGLTGQVSLEQTNSAATTFNVVNAAVSGQNVGFLVETDGKIRYNASLDKTALPTAGECSAPLDGILAIDGLADLGGQLPQIQKEIGGLVIATGFTQSDNTFNLESGASDSLFTDDISPNLFGSDAANLVGSLFTGNVDTFNASNQVFGVNFSACRYSPVEVTTDAAGNFISAVDVNGNDVPENQVVML